MAKTPFYTIIVRNNGRDISDLISKISHEDSVDEDNLLTLNMVQVSPSIIDEDDFKEGTIIVFQYGYRSGKISQKYTARIAEVIQVYGDDGVNITIRCHDLGIAMKKDKSKKVWQNIRSSDIVKQIALTHGLTAVVNQTETIHQFMPQQNMTDYEFIKYLAGIEKDGSWRFFIKNDEIHFSRLKLEKPSIKTLVWNIGDGSIKSFRPYSEESLKDNASRNTVVTTVDPFTNETLQTVIDNSTSKDDVKLGEYALHFNSESENVGRSGSRNSQTRPSQQQKAQTTQENARAGKHVYDPSGDLSEAKNKGNKIKKDSAMHDYKANLTIEGDPDYLSDQIISMAGDVAKKDTGNWYISKATHSITPEASYEVRMQLLKNAGKKPIQQQGVDKATDVNNTAGQDQRADSTVKKEVDLFFNENSRLIKKE